MRRVAGLYALTGWLVASSASMRSASSNRAVALIGYMSDMRNLLFRCVEAPGAGNTVAWPLMVLYSPT